ncbi:BET1-like protein [Lingula anatina]|uniref:BET1-like protein n=1 Tax=Lingula anatina TaxID=7574 RepID=A0A1S3INA7_LINAN|nr:BET1-like protein [Lingula anatina]|eukprot:XP_013399381.1 BET1-like protein [Lingula anatina]
MADWTRRNGNGLGKGQSEEILDRENQQMTENLSRKMNRLKNVAFDMQTEAEDQNRYLDGMGSDFESSQGLLSGSMNRINHMIGANKSNRKIMCYIVLFLVIIFFVVYFLVTRSSGS